MTSRVDVLGVGIDPVTFPDAVKRVLDWIGERGGTARFIVTPNVNHIVLHQEDEAFRQAYANASLVLADGRYVVLLSRLLARKLPEPVNGSDLVPALFDATRSHGAMRVFLLGAAQGIAALAAERIHREWPAVTVVGTYSPPFGFEHDAAETRRIIALVNDARPDLLVVGISPPKQEIWVGRHIGELDTGACICAGATIDFLAGNVSRAPRWVQRIGLEWVFRTAMEPRRLAPRYARDGIAVSKLVLAELRERREKRPSRPG